MAEGDVKNFVDQVWGQFGALSIFKKVAIGVAFAAAISVMILLGELASQSKYEVLFSNLNSEDIGQVTQTLDKYKIPYEVQSHTKAVMVPGEMVLETRMKLAKDGLPKFGGVGFEIFDDKSFGMTEFEQRLNFQRALQGELTRTISQMEEVDDVRVHLVLPEKSVFRQAQEEPSAAVVLRLKAGMKLEESSILGIVHLVSSSVPSLNPKKVTVVDGNGQMLTSMDDDSATGDLAAFRKKHDIEKNYERKVKSLLEPIVGFGKVQVKVTADLDFTLKETTEEKFDPESIAVRSEKKTKSKESGSSAGAGGVVGPNAQAGASSSPGKESSDQTEQVEYEVSKQVQKIVSPVGDVKKLSVAVVVDGKYEVAAEGEEPKYAARTPEEMKNYEDLVKSAIGFNDTRGDQLKVMNLAFQSLDQLFASTAGGSVWQKMFNDRTTYTFYVNVLVNVVIAVIAILIALFLVRPVVTAWLAQRREQSQLALAGGHGGRGGALTSGDVQMRERIQQQAMDDPDNMVKILRSWLE